MKVSKLPEIKKWVKLCAVSGMISVFSMACADKKVAAVEEKPVEIAATVNGATITVDQINEALKEASLPTDTKPEILAEIKNNVLAGLIDEQLMLQQASAQKIDQKPEILNEIEKIKKNLIIETYMTGLVEKIAKPTEEELDVFYKKNENSYKQNIRYVVYQLIARFDQDQAAIVQEGLKKSSQLPDLMKWLTANRISTAQQTNIVDTATLPPVTQQQLANLKVGQVMVQNGPTEMMITEVLRAEAYPITRADLDELAVRQIFATKREEVVKQQIKQLKEKAKIEYSSGFGVPKTPEEMDAMIQNIEKADADATAAHSAAQELSVPEVSEVPPASEAASTEMREQAPAPVVSASDTKVIE